MNINTFLYLSVSCLCLTTLSIKANDPQYATSNKPLHDPRYSKPDISPNDHLSQLPPETRGHINHYLDPKDIGNSQLTNRSNYQAHLQSEFFNNATLDQNEWNDTFDLLDTKEKSSAISFLTWTAKRNLPVSLGIYASKEELLEILPYCNNVKSLRLITRSIDDNIIKTILDSSYLANLQSLDLSESPASTLKIEAITESPNSSRLTSLGVQISDFQQRKQIQLIAESQHLSHLTSLTLQGQDAGLTPEDIAAIAQSHTLQNLQLLVLRFKWVDKGVQEMLNLAMPNLKVQVITP